MARNRKRRPHCSSLRTACSISEIRRDCSYHGGGSGTLSNHPPPPTDALRGSHTRLPSHIPSLAELRLPGLGVKPEPPESRPVGCRGDLQVLESTTLAALIDLITSASTAHHHIEDPVEYEHIHSHILLEQIEVGLSNAPDFPTALLGRVAPAPDRSSSVKCAILRPHRIRGLRRLKRTPVLSTLHTTDVCEHDFPNLRFVSRYDARIRASELAMALAAVLNPDPDSLLETGSAYRRPNLMVGSWATPAQIAATRFSACTRKSRSLE